jgi:hypothetical protein
MIPSWRVLLKLAFARIFCREVYRKMSRGMFSTCAHCGVKLISGVLIIGFAVYTPTFAELSRAQCDAYYRYHDQYKWLTRSVYAIAAEQSRHNRIPVQLTLAVIDAESGGDHTAFNKRSHARGLMQVLARFHYQNKNPHDLLNPRINIEVGTRYLAECRARAGNDLTLTLRNYERGERGTGINIPYTLKIMENIRGTI